MELTKKEKGTDNKIFRPVSVPLVTVDPFFSIWSMSDKLYDDTTRFWTGKRAAMTGVLVVDGNAYRFMGKLRIDNLYYYKELPTIEQIALRVYPTKTEYEFENDILHMTLSFRTPLLMDDLMLMSRPVSYISYTIDFKDGKTHNTRVYFDICSEITSEIQSDIISFRKTRNSVYCGKGNKDVLNHGGDATMIEWGNVHLAMPNARYGAAKQSERCGHFQFGSDLPETMEPCAINEDYPFLYGIREYNGAEQISDFLCVAYDDIYAIEYFHEKIPAFWRKNGDTIEDVIEKAISEYTEINERCDNFDKLLVEDARKISDKYADILSLVYRQVIAAHKLIEKNGRLLFFSKECYSNGCIGTVDVTYPSIPLFLIYNTDLAEGLLNPVFDFVEDEHGWKLPFAPHDMGSYPIANGQAYGINVEVRENNDGHMPVEECGNMLLCTAAICKKKNDYTYAVKHRHYLEQWANYLTDVGYNPDYQLCTDDFTGHLAHNCNLSIKGILGIAAWGDILNKIGEDGDKYIEISKEYAKKWKKNAFCGDRYALSFDNKESWSLKYNLVWDKILDLNIFDKDVAQTEVEYYKTKMNPYGIPLDSRADFTKSDWQIWSTCLTGDRKYRDMVIDAMWRMICEMKSRLPFSDWYWTSKPDMRGFANRTVQGGLYLPMLKFS